MKSQLVPEFAADMERVPAQLEQSIGGILDAITPRVLEGIDELFSLAQSPDGESWPPRKEVGDGHALLIDTTALKSAATGVGAGSVKRVESDTLIVGVDKDTSLGGIPGAGVHNYGFPQRNIPQREFLGLNESAADDCANIIADLCLDKLN